MVIKFILSKIDSKFQIVSISQSITSNLILYPATCVMRQCSCILTVCLILYFNSGFNKTRSTSYISIPLKNDIIISYLSKSFCLCKKQKNFHTCKNYRLNIK